MTNFYMETEHYPEITYEDCIKYPQDIKNMKLLLTSLQTQWRITSVENVFCLCKHKFPVVDVYEYVCFNPTHYMLADSYNTSMQLQLPPSELSWCRLSYNEFEKNVKNFDNISPKHLIVDKSGYSVVLYETMRISLNSLPGVRIPIVKKITENLGKGLRIYNDVNRVFLQNCTSFSIFIHSEYLNAVHNFPPANVIRLEGFNEVVTIFDKHTFTGFLMNSFDFESLNALTSFSTIIVSFGKGFGGDYKDRKITSMPSWICLDLNQPRELLHSVIKHYCPNLEDISGSK